MVPPGALHQRVTAALANWQLDDAEALLADTERDPSPYVAAEQPAGDDDASLGRAWADTLRAELLVRRLRKAGFTLVGAGAHGRGRRTLRTASVLGALGGLGLVMHHTLTLTLTEVLSGGVPATALERLEEGPTAAVSILALLLGVSLAVLLLAAGVARAGRASRAGWWLVAPAVLAVAADFSPSAWNTVGWAVLAMPVFAAAARPGPDTLIRG